jgi:hypothetical protein
MLHVKQADALKWEPEAGVIAACCSHEILKAKRGGRKRGTKKIHFIPLKVAHIEKVLSKAQLLTNA